MRKLTRGFILAAVWLGCIGIFYLIHYLADSLHDVEWAMATLLGLVAGGALGPFLGYGIAKAVLRTK